jgi:hypothetical protein
MQIRFCLGIGTIGRREDIWKGCRRSVLFQEWGEVEIKENDGGGEFNYDIL